MKKVVKKQNGQIFVLKRFEARSKFLLSLSSDSDDDAGMFEFFLRTCIIRAYLMERQFLTILS